MHPELESTGKSRHCSVWSGGELNGCIRSLVLFNYCIDYILEQTLREFEGIVVGRNINLTDLEYAGDVIFRAPDPYSAQQMVDKEANLSAFLSQ